jgi:putative ABC transport system permease protein
MFKLALRNLFRQKIRTLITLTTIMFGVAAVIIAGGFVEDVYAQLRDATIKSRYGYIQLYKAGYYEHGQREPYTYMVEAPQKLITEFERLPGVHDVFQRLNFSAMLNNTKTDRSVIVEGIEPAPEAEFATFLSIIAGRHLTADDAYGIVIGEGVAVALDLAPGDYVNVIANTTYGSMNSLEFEVVGVFQSFSREFDARAVRIPLATAKELLDTTAVHALVFALEDVSHVEPIMQWLERYILGSAYEAKSWLELDDFYPKTVQMYQSQFGVLQLIILVIVLMSVANSVSMTANERIGEFGTLRAIGRTSTDVFRLLLTENAVLGLLGATAGVALGIGVALAISAVGLPMPPPPNANVGYTAYIRIVPLACVSAFFIGLIATVVSALLTCRKPTRIPIADALRQNI